MITYVNLIGLFVTLVLTHVFYSRSVQPAKLSNKIGDRAYKVCGIYRNLASISMMLHVAGYIIYFFYPLPIGLAQKFPWGWTVSIIIAVGIALPALYLMIRGVIDAGEETMSPKKEHRMYGGIYQRIRHPQAMGELPIWLVIAFLLDSPFLVLLSIVWIPFFFWWCFIEERDLVLRYGDAYEEYRRRVGMFFPK